MCEFGLRLDVVVSRLACREHILLICVLPGATLLVAFVFLFKRCLSMVRGSLDIRSLAVLLVAFALVFELASVLVFVLVLI